MQSEPKAKVWPFNGYAPGNYYCKCLTCQEQFTGDKRSFNCLECAISASRSVPSPISADAVVEACAKVSDDHTPYKRQGTLAAHVTGTAISRAIRALKGTFPAAPEAKSESDEAEITTLRKELAEARAALEDSQKLINRIMHVHVAPDECTDYVANSRAWFLSNGGTLSCIAEQNERNQAVLRPPSNAKGEKK